MNDETRRRNGRLPADAGWGSASFVGRSAEIGWLKNALVEAAAGSPRVVFVRGEAGVGKSRLALELLDRAESEGWQTALCRCFQDATHPLAPFSGALLPRMAQAGLLDPEAADRHSSVLMRAQQAGDPGSPPQFAADPSAIGTALAQKMFELAARRPLVVLVDDAQWLDGGALSTFRDIVLSLSEAARARRAPLLLIVTLRDVAVAAPADDIVARLCREPIARSLDVSGLPPAEVNELAAVVTGARCEPLLLDVLFSATRGNPLYLSEALRELVNRGSIDERKGMLRSNVELAELDIPQAAPSAFGAAVSRLPAEFLPLLALAAVLGEEFSVPLLSVVAQHADVGRAVDAAAVAGLVTVEGNIVRFRHALIRQAIVESLGPLEVRRCHSTIAARLMEKLGSTDDYILQLASHVVAGDAPLDAATGALFERAGNSAMAEFSWAIGARYFDQALSNPVYLSSLSSAEQGLLRSKAARSFDNNGDRLGARAAYAAAIPFLREANANREWGSAILGWERTFTNASEPIPDSAPYDEFRASTGDGLEDVHAALLCQWAESLWVNRDARDVGAADRAVQTSMAIDDPQLRALAHTTVGLVRLRHLQPEPALEAFRAAVTETDSISNPRVRGWGAARLSIPLVMMGRISEAAEVARASLRESLAGDDWFQSALNLAMLTVAYSVTGGVEASNLAARDAATMINRSENVQARFLRNGAVVRDRILRGELDEASDALEAWLSSAGASMVRPSSLLVRAAVEGRESVVLDLEARPPSIAHPDVDFGSLGRALGWIDVAGALDLPELAEPLVEPLEAALAGGVEFSVAPPYLVSRSLATAARLSAQFVRAETHLTHALHVAARAGAKPELALTHLEWARLLVARRSVNAESIGGHLKSALTLFTNLGMTAPADEARAIAGVVGLPLNGFNFVIGIDELSTSEAEILECFGQGLSLVQTADQLLISERTAERHLERLRRRLGVSSRADAQRFLTSLRPDLRRPPAGSLSVADSLRPTIDLSPRETEVIRLIALGRTNQQIADELVISLHTVARHVANIFDKTGAANRTEAARLVTGSPNFK